MGSLIRQYSDSQGGKKDRSISTYARLLLVHASLGAREGRRGGFLASLRRLSLRRTVSHDRSISTETTSSPAMEERGSSSLFAQHQRSAETRWAFRGHRYSVQVVRLQRRVTRCSSGVVGAYHRDGVLREEEMRLPMSPMSRSVNNFERSHERNFVRQDPSVAGPGTADGSGRRSRAYLNDVVIAPPHVHT